MNRLPAGVALLLLAAGAAGCGGGSPATKLKIDVGRGGAAEAYSLTCDPASGTVPNPGLACGWLARFPRMLVTPKPHGYDVCGPGGALPLDTFHVGGRYRGRDVDAWFTYGTCGSNGRAWSDWFGVMIGRGAGTAEPALHPPST